MDGASSCKGATGSQKSKPPKQNNGAAKKKSNPKKKAKPSNTVVNIGATRQERFKNALNSSLSPVATHDTTKTNPESDPCIQEDCGSRQLGKGRT